MRLTTSAVFSSSSKFWPLWALSGGINLLLTLDQAEAVVKQNDANGNATQSISFQLSAIVGLADLITLDSALQEKYFQQLASGQTLLWQGSMWDTQEVFIPLNTSGTFAASISKPCSRLMTVLNTFVPRLTQADKQAGNSTATRSRAMESFRFSQRPLAPAPFRQHNVSAEAVQGI